MFKDIISKIPYWKSAHLHALKTISPNAPSRDFMYILAAGAILCLAQGALGAAFIAFLGFVTMYYIRHFLSTKQKKDRERLQKDIETTQEGKQ